MVLTENLCCETLVSQMKVPQSHKRFWQWKGIWKVAGRDGVPGLGETRCLLKKPRTKYVAVV